MMEKRDPKKRRKREHSDIPESARRLRELTFREFERPLVPGEETAPGDIPDSAKLLRELAERR